VLKDFQYFIVIISFLKIALVVMESADLAYFTELTQPQTIPIINSEVLDHCQLLATIKVTANDLCILMTAVYSYLYRHRVLDAYRSMVGEQLVGLILTAAITFVHVTIIDNFSPSDLTDLKFSHIRVSPKYDYFKSELCYRIIKEYEDSKDMPE
jgi:hypothetical protein